MKAGFYRATAECKCCSLIKKGDFVCAHIYDPEMFDEMMAEERARAIEECIKKVKTYTGLEPLVADLQEMKDGAGR